MGANGERSIRVRTLAVNVVGEGMDGGCEQARRAEEQNRSLASVTR